MAQRLTDLLVREVSLVDAPANKGARIALFKRGGLVPSDYDVDPIVVGKTVVAHEVPEVDAYLKREFSADDRKRLASSGAAMPNGGFPIESKADLHNAMQAIGRAKDPAKAKAHIKARAKTLGLTGELTDAFKSASGIAERVKKFFGELVAAAQVTAPNPALAIALLTKFAKDAADGDARDFNEVLAEGEAREYARGVLDEIDEAMQALRMAVSEIMCDEATTDKQAAIEETFGQFKTHIQGVVPEELEKALTAGIAAIAGAAGNPHRGDTMSEALKKALGLTAAATEAEMIAALTKRDEEKAAHAAQVAELTALAKMSDKHKAHMDGLPADKKKAFAALTADDRDAAMQKRQAEDPVLKLADGTEIRKSVVGEGAFAALSSQQAQITKQAEDLAKSNAARELETIVKRVTPLSYVGKADEVGALIHGIAKHDAKAAQGVEKLLSDLNTRLEKSKLFDELGSGRAGTGTATAAIAAKAAELRKAEPKLSIEKARTRVRDENPELLKQEQEEARQSRSDRRAA